MTGLVSKSEFTETELLSSSWKHVGIAIIVEYGRRMIGKCRGRKCHLINHAAQNS